MNKNLYLYLLLSVVFQSCTMSQKKDYTDYYELHKHPGTEHYEVVPIVSEKKDAYDVQFDSIDKHIIVKSALSSKLEKDRETQSLKIDVQGNTIDTYNINTILPDGTMFRWNKYYSNWVINGDTTEHKFIVPDLVKETSDPKEWVNKFNETYKEAESVYYNTEFYFKIKGEWYRVEENNEVYAQLNIDLTEKYTDKYNSIRMVKFKDLMPDMLKKSSERDTTFINKVGYEEKDRESGKGLNPISYSAGYYYLELYMPLGDTIKIKRFGSMDVNMQAYKIPAPMGGRNDVVFLVQEPEEMNALFELGGMYVVRPRNPEQQQYGPHKSSADTFMSGTSAKGGMDPVGKFLEVEEE
ncbi:hypothetical protein [Sinomicrobium sp.]